MNKDTENKQVYWDDKLKRFYWIEWMYDIFGDIPKRHYIDVDKGENERRIKTKTN